MNQDKSNKAIARSPQDFENLAAEPVSSEQEFFDLRSDWNALALGSRAGIFSSFDWAWGWWQHVGRDESLLGQKSLFIVAVRRGGRVVGIAPLMIRRPSRKGLTVRKVEFIGSTFNDYNDFLIGETGPEVLRAWASFILGKKPLWDLIELRSFPESSQSQGILRDAFAELGLPHRVVSDDPCPYIRLTSDWRGMLKNLSRNTRLTFHNQANRLERLRELGYRERVIENPHEEPGLLARMAEVERRKQVHGARGDRLVARAPGFFNYLFKNLAPAGRLIFAVMEKGEQLLAYQLGFRVGRIIWDYTTAFDPSFGNLSPGTMLLPQVFDYAHHHGYEEFDFLRGDEPYKRRLAKSTHATWRVQVWKPEAASRSKAFIYFHVRPRLYRQRWAARLGLPYAPHGEV